MSYTQLFNNGSIDLRLQLIQSLGRSKDIAERIKATSFIRKIPASHLESIKPLLRTLLWDSKEIVRKAAFTSAVHHMKQTQNSYLCSFSIAYTLKGASTPFYEKSDILKALNEVFLANNDTTSFMKDGADYIAAIKRIFEFPNTPDQGLIVEALNLIETLKHKNPDIDAFEDNLVDLIQNSTSSAVSTWAQDLLTKPPASLAQVFNDVEIGFPKDENIPHDKVGVFGDPEANEAITNRFQSGRISPVKMKLYGYMVDRDQTYHNLRFSLPMDTKKAELDAFENAALIGRTIKISKAIHLGGLLREARGKPKVIIRAPINKGLKPF